MCYHSEAEMRRYLHREARRTPHMSVVIMREPETLKFQEAYHCAAHDVQDIADTIRNLRAWHPEEHVVDLTQVNAKREELDKKYVNYREYFKGQKQPLVLTEADLPKARGKAPKSEDDYAVRGDDMVDPALKKLKVTPPKKPTKEELVAAYDEAQKLQRTKMAVEHALKKGFPESLEVAALAEQAEQARVTEMERVEV